MSGGVTYSEIISAVSFLIVLIGTLGGLWWRVHTSIARAEDLARQDRDAMKARIEEVRAKGAHELSEFKLEVTRNYASLATLEALEERVVDAINRLGDRFDRYFENTKPRSTRRDGGS